MVKPASNAPSRFAERENILLALLWCAIASVCATLFFVSRHAVDKAHERLAEQARSYAHLISSHDRHFISQAENLISALEDHLTWEDLNAEPTPERRKHIAKLMKDLRSRLPGIASFTAIGADGVRRFGVVGKDFTDLSKRGYFMALKEKHTDLFVSFAEEGLASGKPGIHIAKRFPGPDGTGFGGVIVINLAINDVFNPFYASLRLGSGSEILLRDARKLLILYPPSESAKPGSPISDPFAEPIGRGESSLSSKIPSPFDGAQKMSSVERLPGTDIYAQVSLSYDEAVLPAFAVALGALLAAGMIVAVGAMVSFSFKQNLRQKKKIEENLETISFMAHHDSLTKLPNRSFVNKHFADVCSNYSNMGGQVALIFIDLDRFKWVNDSMGHAAGDSLLIQAASRMKAACSTADILSRLGGDEFVVLHPMHNVPDPEADARLLCHKILDAFKTPFQIDSHTVASGASLGAALFPAHGSSFEELSRKADIAMYRSKARGRGAATVYYDGIETEQAQQQIELHSLLVDAIEKRSFSLRLLPARESGSPVPAALKACLCLNDPSTGKPLFPPDYLPFAETVGLAGQLGTIAIDLACAEIARLKAAGASGPAPAIPLTETQFSRGNIYATLETALAKNKLAPSDLIVALPEEALLAKDRTVFGKTQTLLDRGYLLAIDNFGASYASAAGLARANAKLVFLDDRIAKELTAQTQALTHAVIGIAQAFGASVIAQGARGAEQQEFFRKAGCRACLGLPDPEEPPSAA